MFIVVSESFASHKASETLSCGELPVRDNGECIVDRELLKNWCCFKEEIRRRQTHPVKSWKSMYIGITMLTAKQTKSTLSLDPRSLQTKQTIYKDNYWWDYKQLHSRKISQYKRMTAAIAGSDTGHHKRYQKPKCIQRAGNSLTLWSRLAEVTWRLTMVQV